MVQGVLGVGSGIQWIKVSSISNTRSFFIGFLTNLSGSERGFGVGGSVRSFRYW